MKIILDYIMQIKRAIPFLQSRIPEKHIYPIVSICLGYKLDGKWKFGDVAFGRDKTDSLFRNGVFFFRVIFCPIWMAGWLSMLITIGVIAWFWLDYRIDYPHWVMALSIGFVGLGVRWAGRDPSAMEYIQTYIGVKLNGEWALIPRFRIQSDVSAAEGTTGANYGQAVGWNEGNK